MDEKIYMNEVSAETPKKKSAAYYDNGFGGVTVMLDRPREMKLSHKAMKKFAAITGCSLEDMDVILQNPTKLEALYYVGLQEDARQNGEALTSNMMENILDNQTPGVLIAAAAKAVELAYDVSDDVGGEGDEGNGTAAAGTIF